MAISFSTSAANGANGANRLGSAVLPSGVGQPFASGSELTLENGYAALYRGSAGGLIPTAAWLKFGETGGIHTGADVGPIGDLNGDGRGDFAIATRDEGNAEGLLRGRVTYFLGRSNTASIAETFRTWGVNASNQIRSDAHEETTPHRSANCDHAMDDACGWPCSNAVVAARAVGWHNPQA